MIAWTSPMSTVRLTPLRICRPPGAATRAWRFLISSRAISVFQPSDSVFTAETEHAEKKVQLDNFFSSPRSPRLRGSNSLPNRSFERHAQQLLRFHRELHRELSKNFLAEPVHDHVHGVFQGDAAGLAIKEL